MGVAGVGLLQDLWGELGEVATPGLRSAGQELAGELAGAALLDLATSDGGDARTVGTREERVRRTRVTLYPTHTLVSVMQYFRLAPAATVPIRAHVRIDFINVAESQKSGFIS